MSENKNKRKKTIIYKTGSSKCFDKMQFKIRLIEIDIKLSIGLNK